MKDNFSILILQNLDDSIGEYANGFHNYFIDNKLEGEEINYKTIGFETFFSVHDNGENFIIKFYNRFSKKSLIKYFRRRDKYELVKLRDVLFTIIFIIYLSILALIAYVRYGIDKLINLRQ